MSNDSEYHWIHTPPVFMLQIEALWHNMQQAKVMLEICPSPTEFEFFKLSWVPKERLTLFISTWYTGLSSEADKAFRFGKKPYIQD